ncbi:hemin ABC transporter ATP-binding protein [Leifsonia sp. Root4]|uniref:heme ABC transporter ATP-binding protein n=1 Tax=Leifsonia sp. Root4 TaxID=1736525 RepID=UPI000701EC30|nr:heme ABC transporter ATP-binding protein [Leifsonia sp. Root4]KQW08333.1 hemin ABC transporter ATP-binding protein [Leifsonia sp. Root4]
MSIRESLTEVPDAAAPAAPSTPAPSLAARGLSVTIDGARLLDDVDFEARPGELHALLGPNGAGKSTLLGALAGDVTPSAGTASLDGRPLATWKLRELARVRAVLLQQHEVFFPFTVREVVEMGRAPWRGTAAEDDDERMIAEAMALTDITALASRSVPSLSGGERARAALARVLAQGASTLMLDEPTAALDLKHQEDVMRLARERAASGDTVIVVLHDLNVAAAYADRVTLLQRGRVVASGEPRAVLTAERIAAVYGQAVEVLEHPRTGTPLILPLR